MYTLFLSPKGKVITDAFLIRPQVFENNVAKSKDDQIWIDVDADMQIQLVEHMKKYTWKKRVDIVNLSYAEDDAPEIHAGFNKNVPKFISKMENVDSLSGKYFDI